MNRYEVDLFAESDLMPEEDRIITQTVDAADRDAAIESARLKLREVAPDVNHLKVWAWNTRRLYT